MKVSIELPVATRHRRDMTEKMLKATLNLNKQQQQLETLIITLKFQQGGFAKKKCVQKMQAEWQAV